MTCEVVEEKTSDFEENSTKCKYKSLIAEEDHDLGVPVNLGEIKPCEKCGNGRRLGYVREHVEELYFYCTECVRTIAAVENL